MSEDSHKSSEIIDSALDTKILFPAHPSYKYLQKFQRTGGTSIIGGINSSGGTEAYFDLDPQLVFNLCRSGLRYDMVFGNSGANTAYFVHDDGVPELMTVELLDESGKLLTQILNANYYVNMVLRPETKLKEVKANADGKTDIWEGLRMGENYLSNIAGISAVVYPGIQQLQDAYIPSLNLDSTNGTAARAPYFDKFESPRYITTTGVAAAAGGETITISKFYQLGKVFKETILALDKCLYFGQKIYLKLTFAPINKVCWTQTTALTPGGALNPAIPANNCDIQNLMLYLCTEQNPVNQQMIKDEVSKGMSILVPYLKMNKVSVPGQQKTVETWFNSTDGKRLRKVYTGVYNLTTASGTNPAGQGIAAYDKANLTAPGLPTGINQAPIVTSPSKILNFNTYVNSEQTTQYVIDCTQHLDYFLMKPILEGSAILSEVDYKVNWFYCDDFTQQISPNNQTIDQMNQNKSDGLSLDKEQRYTFRANCNTYYSNSNLDFFVYGVVDRLLVISPGATNWA